MCSVSGKDALVCAVCLVRMHWCVFKVGMVCVAEPYNDWPHPQDHLKCLNERREKEKMDVYQVCIPTLTLIKVHHFKLYFCQMQAKAHTAGLPKQEPCLVANSWLQQWQNFIQCKTLGWLINLAM